MCPEKSSPFIETFVAEAVEKAGKPVSDAERDEAIAKLDKEIEKLQAEKRRIVTEIRDHVSGPMRDLSGHLAPHPVDPHRNTWG